jgi:hypothetical protein
MPESNEEYMQVWVKKQHLASVYQFIAELEKGEGVTKPTADGQDVWSEELLKEAFGRATESMQAVLKHLASRPEEAVPSQELVDLVKPMYQQPDADFTLLAGVIGGFGRWVVRPLGLRNARGNAILPFKNPRDPRIGSRVYIMSRDVAEVIAAI